MKIVFIVSTLFLLTHALYAWECEFTFDGYFYNLTSASSGTGPDSSNGLWTTGNTGNPGTFFFQLCQPTTSTPNVGNSNECNQITPTQVCQQDNVNLDWSCGIDPTTTPYGDPGEGVVMAASGGSSSGCTSGRSSFVRVICPAGTGFDSGLVKFIEENPTCTYTLALYHDVGCGELVVPTPSPTPALAPTPVPPTPPGGPYTCCSYYNFDEEFATHVCQYPGALCPAVVTGYTPVGNTSISSCSQCCSA
eukprot:CAMPEP_0201510096 /NCGR_PEP_ID=MMETSP0161_2-20130828/2933_1 /ASSEMBLY_ACC=CAM_ASM_000251 /TAXON_ID=180227 /ORGANISM="Neoparamoeba aestuarina, Strain SoJaBio B1-5/56/2" /LENGTH=248 /DNA_ID=CAMNT_0047905225 /DNA_START=111 /DNA_END=857 /DNA_ORIENTATION=-